MFNESYFFLFIAVVLEVTANFFLKRSEGMKYIVPGVTGIICILASFSALSRALKGIDMATAYGIWGGCGVVLTAAIGWVVFGQRFGRKVAAGLALITAGMVLMKLVN
ncbi:TPA: multidrug/spermidine efflux SMR transporter subunit MdtI [Citrobacter freundii]|nr:multidrug/spermidine efflux SMR transporter subunit MdtI [Citrobacter freundii]HBM9967995.1 multidrug/spermidine efflux SMR transporter subunit MdtI [Enterobacter chengduensis]HBH6881782.1 multidrug/spermidine efflux SMR transporter subunit MdtI [Citrobacter freundii]HBH6984915.1 multidrug/spermidine efflux SMR transporter subunit MdtI [Citrobacter freundii]HBN0078409.1 multidrug/spermidine efflux SMR transporter subunit MdtI [Enterobacter chengduensis]